MQVLIATTNANKVREIQPLLATLRLELVTLIDLPSIPEPEEGGTTYWENARAKALAYARASGLMAVAEDSGFEIGALAGQPGVHSSRFLGADVPYPARFQEIYRRMAAMPHSVRDARFVTTLAAAQDDEVVFETETMIAGQLADAPRGEHGFGYDPIFFYPPLDKTTAEMTLSEKNAVSHRARAFRDFVRWLRRTK